MKFAIALACLLVAVAADQSAEEWRRSYWGHHYWPGYYNGYHGSSSAYIAPTRWGGWSYGRHRRSADAETTDMSADQSGWHGYWGDYWGHYPHTWRHGSWSSGGWNHGGVCRGSGCRHARSVDQQTSEGRYSSWHGYHPYGWWGPSYSRTHWGAYPYTSYETASPNSYAVRHY